MQTDINQEAAGGGAGGTSLIREADECIRENPVPAVLGALAIGFLLGLLVRSMEREERASRWRDYFEDSEDYVRSMIAPVSKKTKRAYRRSSDAVRDAVGNVVDAARDIDVDEYTDPVAKWFRRVWKRCCS